ncbi:hypothetical protein RND81_10G150200 [Saponaria officinalis]|uniref:PGG domain-containing protein n=1 Tax=Saponaria officinalis TaxID=3572 RepID=A0AAW1I292_SAPOF
MQQFNDIESDVEYTNIKKELYKALYGHGNESHDLVIDLCKKLPYGAMHVFTIHNDTPLHKATYTKNFDLALKLLDQFLLSENFSINRLMYKNDWGNNLLHNAATSNKGADFVKKLLSIAPEMLREKNRWGETASFQAVRYGRRHVFIILANEIDKFCASYHRQSMYNHLYFFQRYDKTTILHMAILTGYYDIGLTIARRYEHLCNEAAQDGWTPLQILARTPSAFFSGNEMGFLKRRIYSYVQANETWKLIRILMRLISCIFGNRKSWCAWPAIDMIRSEKESHENVLKLAKILVSLDTSWQDTNKPGSEIKPSTAWTMDISIDHDKPVDRTLDISQNKSKNNSVSSDVNHTPLIMAAKTGCIEIVDEILEQFPQAVEYLNHDGQNVLLVAVKNRNMNVFHHVNQKNLDIRSNLRVIDRHGNCLLHMVGWKKEIPAGVKLKIPVLQLSEDLQLFEDLQMRCPTYLLDHRNDENKTPYELMEVNNEELRSNAKDWLKRTAEHCTAIIILIATVAFAAAYTVPGGPNQQTGFPILIGKPFFLAFTMTDVLSLTFALTAAVIFLSLLTSSYKLQSFSRSLPQKVLLGLTLLFLSVTMMMVSFAATIILMTSRKKEWTKIAVYTAAFFPVCIFVVSYIPLYVELANTFRYWFFKCRKILPVPACTSKPKYSFRRGGI